MPPSTKQVTAGQAVYTPGVLTLYDTLVLGFSNRYLWKCPSSKIEAHYNAHVSSNHLDVGAGTGYFPDRCTFPSETPRVALMDLNPNTLAFASKRIARYRPETIEQNILEPIQSPIQPFDSVGINYVLHCVPGSLSEKAVLFDHLRTVMNPGCRVFGATILYGEVPRNRAAQKLMALYNRRGIFSNTDDDVSGLEEALSQRLKNVQVDVAGCVALFSGHAS